MSSVDQILAQLGKLIEQTGYIKADIDSLRQDVESSRHEYRDGLMGLRGDLTLFVSRFNAATETNKKKLTALQKSINDS